MHNVFGLFGKKKSLLSHSFFTTINKISTYDIYTLPIKNNLKKKVVIFFLKEELENIYRVAKETAVDIDNVDLSTLESSFIDALGTARKNCINNGVPTVFLERFQEWDESHVETMLSGIKHIAESSFYTSNYTKMVTILDLLTTLIQLQILDVEKTINSMNGDLERAIKGTVFDT